MDDLMQRLTDSLRENAQLKERIAELEKRLEKVEAERDRFKQELRLPRSTIALEILQDVEDAPADIWAGSCAVADGNVYIRECRTKAVYEYNPSKKEWRELALHPHRAFTLVCVDNILTTVGGEHRVLYLLIEKSRWEPYQAPELPTKRCVPMALYSQHKLVVAGGIKELVQHVTSLSVVEVLDTRTKQWTSVSSLPFGLHQTTMVKVRDCIYVHVSIDHGRDLYLIQSLWSNLLASKESSKDVWEDCKWPQPQLSRTTLEVFEGQLLAIGGKIDGKPTTEIYSYREVPNMWEVIGNMSIPRDECRSAVLSSNRLMVVGSRSIDSNRRKVDILTLESSNRTMRACTL